MALSFFRNVQKKPDILETRVFVQEEARIAKDALQRSEEAADLLAEKSMIAEQVRILYIILQEFLRVF